MDFTNTVSAFLLYAVDIRGYQPSTIKQYKGILRRFSEQNQIKTVSDIRVMAIETYLEELSRSGIKTGNLFNIVTCLRAFGKYLNKRDLSDEPFHHLETPRRKRNKVETITREDLHALLNNFNNGRDRLMALIMFGSGIRVSELVNMKVEDIRGQEFTVVGKGAKPRLVILPKDVASLLSAFLVIENIQSGHIFRSSTGKPVGAASVRHAIKKAAKEAGIKQRVYPHLLRHMFATVSLENGMPLVAVAEQLGHNQYDTTERYLHISDAYKREAHNRYAPQISVLKIDEIPELHKQFY